ncbi:MAG: transcription termination/antitermination protein NusG [Firmicutes bacterium]|nr:transcription termination/antitermination protein NusG [Bacillota bacterium]
MEEKKEEEFEIVDIDAKPEDIKPAAEEVAVAVVPLDENLTEKEREILLAKNSPESKWYAIHTFSGYENMAKSNLNIVIERNAEILEKRIFEISIPEEEVIIERNGKRKVVKQKIMPGYILVKMIYGDDIWHLVTKTKGITGFVGPAGRALALTEEEVRRMKLETIRVAVALKVGDKIEIIDGPLEKMTGTVISIDAANQKVRANVEMFGRETPVDIELTHIRKI